MANGTRNTKRWSKRELALLKKYKDNHLIGKGMSERLPGRTALACVKKARSLGWYEPRVKRTRPTVSLHIEVPGALYSDLVNQARVAGKRMRHYILSRLEKQ